MKTLIKCLLLVLMYSSFSSTSAFACSCTNIQAGKSVKQRIKDQRKKSKAVFAGEVVEIIEAKTSEGKPAGYVEVRFKVDKSWKGVNTEEVRIFTFNICCICGYQFSVGESYLVYAYGNSTDQNQLWTNICTRTTKLMNAAEDVKVLGKKLELTKK